ncbi:MAG: exo-alpha-sialidase [Fermentimonas sp.]
MRIKDFFLIALTMLMLSCGRYSEDIKVEMESPILPLLTGKEYNPVKKIRLTRNSDELADDEAYQIERIALSISGDDISEVQGISLFKAGNKEKFETNNLIESLSVTDKVSFEYMLNVPEDTITLWIALTLNDDVELSHKIRVEVDDIKTSRGKLIVDDSDAKDLRLGVAVRQHNQDGVHTSRIPGLATSKTGTLMAIFDARYDSARDLQGDIDIAMNRSFDGGRTWEPMQVVLDMGEWGGMPEKFNGVSDANILVDENSGDIYVAGLWMYGVLDNVTGKWVEGLTADSTRWIHQWHKMGSQPGYDVKQTSQFLITKSTDDGKTWSEPINITKEKKAEWWLYAPAPGQGITMADGTLVMPTQGRDENGTSFSNITWSKDGGKTWTASNPASIHTTECAVVELSDGSLMLNMRDNRNRGNEDVNGRSVFITKDMGETWTEHHTSRKALIEPTCMGSLHKHTYKEKGEDKSVLLFVNPASKSKRNNITLKVSFDDGNTWLEDNSILLDEYSGRGYSCITSVDESTIGILYESSQADMVFQTISLEEILSL